MDTGQDRWLEQFTGHLLNERRLSPHTVSNYRRDIKTLASYCEREGVVNWSDLDTFHIRSYAAFIHRNGLSPRSIQRRISAIRTFFNYLYLLELLDIYQFSLDSAIKNIISN